ncbi:MAG TPA: STM3941 family protein [Verrucomicrobiae bacterium]
MNTTGDAATPATLGRRKRLGLTKAYCATIFLFFLLGIFALTTEPNPNEHLNFRLIGVLFLALAGLSILWPVLRLREKEELRFATLKSGNELHVGILVPVSPANQLILGIGSLVLAGLCLTMALSDDVPSARMKGWLGFAIFLGAFIVFIITILRNKPGILLTEEGIAWNEYFHGPAFIAWEQITRAEAFLKQERYTKSHAFGLAVRDPNQIRASLGTIGSAKQRFNENGFHFLYEAESILFPPADLQSLVQHYLDNPHRRLALSTGATLDQLPTILAVTSQVQTPDPITTS